MANRNFPSNKLYNSHVMPVLVDMQIAIGNTGAPTVSSAPLVQSVTRLAAGIYQIQLKDNYNSLLGMWADAIAPVSGSATDPHSIAANTLIQITTVGNTDWHTAGLSASITPAVGVTFYMTAQPGSATTGFAKTIGSSGVSKIELCGQMMNSNNPQPNNGAVIIVKCLAQSAAAPTLTMDSYTPAGTNDSATPPIFTGTPAVLTGTISAPALSSAAADPASGSKLQIALYLNNSSVM